eukprot:TRINITY_DN4296_c0_g1_i1.p1 TRINITY_DN4296_c0_g1~~TRINITY_DN4296_c0_g1_i1.p1  ORF type:complete len:869 (+),score=206.91 TRINITY_DN4296_c0_g1_i1:46-2652(+)
MSYDKKDDYDIKLPYSNLDKGQLLQQVKIFSQRKLKAKKCLELLTSLVYILNSEGDSFTEEEGTLVFIGVTKLFQSTDVKLRRMTYLMLRELTKVSRDTIIAFAILVKDLNSNVELYKSNALRVISSIIDGTTISQMERFLKQNIVHTDPYVASAALVSCMHMTNQSVDVARKCANEVQDAVQSRDIMVQYHALGLLYQAKKNDALAISKLIKSSYRNMRSQFGQCLLVKFAVKVIRERGTKDPDLMEFLLKCVNHRQEMVVYEAARNICVLPGVTENELKAAISGLMSLFNSSRSTIRFAAARTLAKVADEHPELLRTMCAYELDGLITDSNTLVATLAITTLLKIENESRLSHLLKQVNILFKDNNLEEEYKIVVIKAIAQFCFNYPGQYEDIITYMNQLLEEEGAQSFGEKDDSEYIETLVDAQLNIASKIEGAKEQVLENMCNFIEDCNFPAVTCRILHVIGEEGPKSSYPSKYLRFIYNRISLEYSQVRAAAVSALSKFGFIDYLRTNVLFLIQNSLLDEDDEVRDRATFYMSSLEKLNDQSVQVEDILSKSKLSVPLANLEASLLSYLSSGTSEKFDISGVQTYIEEVKPVKESIFSIPEEKESEKTLPELGLGALISSSSKVALTERETEYIVDLVKHTYENHILLEFNITNTLDVFLLENLTIDVVPLSDSWRVTEVLPISKLPFNTTKSLFVVLQKPQSELLFPTMSMLNTLKFTLNEIDPDTQEVFDRYPDEYTLEESSIRISDYVKAKTIGNFQEMWEELGENEQTTVSGLPTSNMEDAVTTIKSYLGLAACEGSDEVTKKSKHALYLSGLVGSSLVLARARMVLQTGSVAVELIIKCEDELVRSTLSSIFSLGSSK